MQAAKRSTRIVAALGAAAASVSFGSLVSLDASAAELDGSRDLVCAAVNVVACVEGTACTQGPARTYDLPEFIFVDVKAKVIRARHESGLTNLSLIHI